jgi:quercetin dioxygenase-like cupin family protein
MPKNTPLVHLRPSDGKRLGVGKFGFSFKAGRAVGSAYAVAEVTAPPGVVNALHRHPNEETMYVLAGEFEMFGEDGEKRRVGPGAVIHVPQNVAHGFVNAGDGTGRLLLVAPVGQEALFDDLSEAMASPTPGPSVAAVFARHHVETGLRLDAGSR